MGDKKVAIKGEPLKTPNGLKMEVTFNDNSVNVKATWSNPDAATKDSYANRYTGVLVKFYLDVSSDASQVTKNSKVNVVKVTKQNSKKKKKGKKVAEKKKVTTQKIVGVKEYKTVIKRHGLKTTSSSVNFAYSDVYPSNGSYKVDCICVQIQGYNSTTANAKAVKNKKGKVTGYTYNTTWDSTVPYVSAVKQLYFPKNPEITKSFAAASMQGTFNYTSVDEGDGHHVYDTVWTFKVIKTYSNYKTDTLVNVNETSNRAMTLPSPPSYSMNGQGNNYININEKIEAYMSAKCRGMHGDSDTIGGYNDDTKGITSNGYGYKRIWAYPHDLVVDRVQKTSDSDPLVVFVGVAKGNVNRQTDTIQLQRVKDFFPANMKDVYKDKYRWRDLVVREGSWEDIGDPFNYGQWAITRNYDVDRPSSSNPYSRSYYRIVSKNETFKSSDYYRTSGPIEVPGYLNVPSAKDEKVDFLEIISGSDGTSVRVTLAYTIGTHQNAPNPSDETVNGSGSDGCELTWSEFEHAWESNNPPTPFDMPDLDITGELRFRNPTTLNNAYNDAQWLTTDTAKLAQLKNDYEYTSTAYVTGLTEGTPYYFRARRYLEADGALPRTYGPYSFYKGNVAFGTRQETIVPSTKPTKVVATVKEMFPVGKDLEVSWTFDSDSTQKAWKVLWYDPKYLSEVQDTNQSNVKKSKTWSLKSGATGGVLREGTDAAGYTVIPYYTERNANGSIKTKGLDEILVKNQIGIVVSMATTGEFTSSAPVLVSYVDPPKAALGMASEINFQPVRMTLGTNDSLSSAIVRITAVDMTTVAMPDGIQGQPVDTIVYSRKYFPEDLGWREDPLPSSSSSEGWSSTVPAFSEEKPSITHTYRYEISGGTSKLATPMPDDPLTEIGALETVPEEYSLLWYLSDSEEEPNPPSSHVTSSATTESQWTRTMPTRTLSCIYYYYCYEYLLTAEDYEYIIQDPEATDYASANPQSLGWYQKDGPIDFVLTSDTTTLNGKDYFVREPVSGTYRWTSVIRDTSLEDALSDGAIASSLEKLYQASGSLGYYANIQLPLGLEMYSGKVYEVSLTIVNDDRELDSRLMDSNGDYQPLKMRFTANYDHQAEPPSRAHTRVFSDKNTLSTRIVIGDSEEHISPRTPAVAVVETGTAPKKWTLSVPIRSDRYTEYYHAYQYAVGGVTAWSASEYDAPKTDLSKIENPGSPSKIWYLSDYPTVPSSPTSEIVESGTVKDEWTTAYPGDYDTSYRYCFFAYQYLDGGEIKFTSIGRDNSLVEALKAVEDPSTLAQIWYLKEKDHMVGDLCDIYRVTPDGAALISENVSYGSTVIDKWAPYSKYADTRYRIATRTVDGNREWDDFAYFLPHYAIRFDWGNPEISKTEYTSLEIPYNLTYSDSFKKYFEARHHLGEKKPAGYWEEGVDRTSSFTTDIVKYDNTRDKEALRALAAYAGPVMVRRPDGCAYLANVEVNNIGNDYKSQVQSVSFTVTEISLTDRYMAETGTYTSATDRDYILGLNTVPANFGASKLYNTVAQSPTVNVAKQI